MTPWYLISRLGIKFDKGSTLRLYFNMGHKETAVSATCSLQHAPLGSRPVGVGLVILAARCSKESAPMRPAPHKFFHRPSSLYQTTYPSPLPKVLDSLTLCFNQALPFSHSK